MTASSRVGGFQDGEGEEDRGVEDVRGDSGSGVERRGNRGTVAEQKI